MMDNGHLDIFQIQAYTKPGASIELEQAVERHALVCKDCRDRLPTPSKQDLWRAVFEENEVLNASDESVSSYKLWWWVPQYRKTLLVGLLALLIGMGALLGLRTGIDGNEVDLAGSGVRPEPSMSQDDRIRLGPYTQPSPVIDEVQGDGEDDTKAGSRSSRKTEIGKDQGSHKSFPPRSPARQQLVSVTRGKQGCTDQIRLNGLIRKTPGGIELKWDKVPNALKYNIYITDQDENLIDEFETTGETSHVLKTKLDTQFLYRWKLLATLEGGKSITTTMQTFTTDGAVPEKDKGLGKLSVSNVRCVSEKQ